MEIEGFHGLKAYISFFYELNMSLIARLIITETTLGIPIGTYAFLEFFCVDPDCDCRKTSNIVMDEDSGAVMATIHYGWVSEEY